MSLKDRKEAAQKEEASKNKMPNGTYRVRMVDWEFGKSQKKQDKYVVTWKVRKIVELKEELPEGMEKADLLKKKRKQHFMVGLSFSLIELLDILEAAGADLEKYDEVSDIDTIFEQIEDAKYPLATLEYEHEEGAQYPNVFKISDVENVLGDAEESEEEEEESSDVPDEQEAADAEEEEGAEEEAPALKAKAKPKKKKVRAPGTK